MAAYASIDDVQERFGTVLDATQAAQCNVLLEDAAVIIDSYNVDAKPETKKLVSCRMVIRALDFEDDSVPIGATQGTMSALGYSQTWNISAGGSGGELYLGKMEKQLLGVGNKIGAHSPLEDMN